MSTNENVTNASETAPDADQPVANDNQTRMDQIIARWRDLEPNQNIVVNMTAIPHRSIGSKFGNDTIRIDGSMNFIDSALSNLQSLLDGNTDTTRINVTIMPIVNKPDRFACYIHLAERSTLRRGRPKGSKNAPKYVAVVAEPKNDAAPQNAPDAAPVDATNVDNQTEQTVA